MNKGNAKFTAIPGGSKNTLNGRYAFSLGGGARIADDNAASLSLDGSSCVPPGPNSMSICASRFEVNGNDVIDLFYRRRELEEAATGRVKVVGELVKAHGELEKEFYEREQRIETMLKQLQSYTQMQEQHKLLKATLEQVKSLSAAA